METLSIQHRGGAASDDVANPQPTTQQRQDRTQGTMWQSIFFPDGYTCSKVEVQTVPCPTRPSRIRSQTPHENDDYMIRFNQGLGVYKSGGFNSYYHGGRQSKPVINYDDGRARSWFWRIDSSSFNPLSPGARFHQIRGSQQQSSLSKIEMLYRRFEQRGECFIFATKWSDPITYQSTIYPLTTYNYRPGYESQAGVRVGITNFGNLVINLKPGEFPSQEEIHAVRPITIQDRIVHLYQYRTTPLPPNKMTELRQLLSTVIIPFLKWTSQLEPLYQGGVQSFNFEYKLLQCRIEYIIPLLLSFLSSICDTVSTQTQPQHVRRAPNTQRR